MPRGTPPPGALPSPAERFKISHQPPDPVDEAVLAAIALHALAGHEAHQRLSNRKANRLAHGLILESNGHTKEFGPPVALARPVGGLGGRGQFGGETRKKLTC